MRNMPLDFCLHVQGAKPGLMMALRLWPDNSMCHPQVIALIFRKGYVSIVSSNASGWCKVFIFSIMP